MSSDAGFQLITLGELGDFKNGANFSQDDYGAGYPIINVKQLYGGRYIDLHGLESLGKKVLKRPEQLFLEAGDILFARSSVKRSGAGQCALVPHGVIQTIFSGFIIRYRLADKSATNPMFLAYLLQSPMYREIFPRIATGTTISNLSQDALKQIQILLPEKQTQDEVASLLGALDDRIALLRETNATLEAIAQALFKSWFVDFDPVRAKQQGLAPEGMDEATAELFPDGFEESELGLIPIGWKTAMFGDFIHRQSVGKKYDQNSALAEGVVPILDQGKSGVIGFHNDTPGVTANIDNPVVVFANHTCYMRLITFDFSAIQNVLPFVGKGVNTIWAFYATKGRLRFSEYKGHWPEFVIEKAVVPIEALTNAFRSNVEPLVRKMRGNDLLVETLASLRDTLLPRLISGQLRLPEAEALLEDA